MDIFNRTFDHARASITYKDYPYIVYGRVSTENDEQVSSLQNQIDICHNWLERHHYEWSEKSVLLDDGISGTTILERKAMRQLLNRAKNNEIKMVLFKSISRLARDLKDALEIKEVLLSARVRVVALEEGYDSLTEAKNDMKFEMFAMFAAQYPRSISMSVSAAFAAKVRRGEYRGGKVPYGYCIQDKRLSIKEDEAAVIRSIFRKYNQEQLGFKRITKWLNKELFEGKVPPPKQKKTWRVTTVESIIKNPRYCGVVIMNRYETIKVNGRKKQIVNPPEKWSVFLNQHPKIVSVEEWKKANRRDIKHYQKRMTHWNEFQGILRCSHCGASMVILQTSKLNKDGTRTHWYYMKCGNYRRNGKCACENHVPIHYEDFRSFLINQLKRQGSKLIVNVIPRNSGERELKVQQLKNQLEHVKLTNKKLLDLYINDSLISKSELLKRQNDLLMQKRKVETELCRLQSLNQKGCDKWDVSYALSQLEDTNSNLKDAFHVLFERIMIHSDGQTDINYRFKENE